MVRGKLVVQKNILITASGGGHTGHAVALAQRLVGKANLSFIVPEGDEWSRKKVERYGKIYYIPKLRQPNQSIVRIFYRLPKALVKSFSSIDEHFDFFVSGGSNHSVPPAIVAKIKGIPIVNIESSVRFVRPGRTPKLLSYISKITVLQWPEQKKILPRGTYFGPLYEKPEYQVRDEGYVLVTGGTYGHKKLFDLIDKLGLENVVLQTGRVNPEPYKKKHPNWKIFSFDPNFPRWIAGASIVISHLGKTIIDAALTYRKPVIIVPNPEWSLTAGTDDARYLAEKLNAILIDVLDILKLKEAIDEAPSRIPPRYEDGAEKLAQTLLSDP